MTDERQPISEDRRRPTSDDQRPTTFAMSCFVAAVLAALVSCTEPNPNYRKPHNDAAENNHLGSLSVSPGALTPAFDSDTTIYSVDVASTVISIAVTATTLDGNASMTVNGQDASSAQQSTIALNDPGVSTPIVVVVTAVNGSQNTYAVTVNRAAAGGGNRLQSLSVSPGTLAPAFDPSTTTYSVNVASNAGTVAVTATYQDSHASMTVNEQPTSSGQQRTISLNGPGTSTQISVVIAANGSQNTYVLTVNRAALSGNNKLQSLSVSPGSFTEAFDPNTKSYLVAVSAVVGGITVTAQPQDSGATVTINGEPTGRLVVPLGGAGTSTTIAVKVTAPNGADNTYTIYVFRSLP